MSIGRPALTSRSEIIQAARHLLQTEGVDALSVRNVAAAVNTAASTIYNYFGSKQGLLRELADAMLSEARPQLRPDQDPIAALRQWMYDYRELLRKTPELIILANLSGPVPSVFAIGHDLVTLLERAGLSPKDAALHGRSLHWTVHGFVWQEVGEERAEFSVVDLAPPEHRAAAKRAQSYSYDQLYQCTVERNLAGLINR